MIKALNIRLYPNQEQEILMYKYIGSMRFIYNWALDKQIKYYKNTNKKLSTSELGKELTILKNTDDFKWLYEVSNATLKESIRDLDKAYKNFFNGSGFPKFKSKKKSRLSFYGRVWVLSVGIDVQTQNIKLNNLSIGIDLGIKQLSITNIDELDTKNINKSSKVKKLSKKLKKLQRQCSKKYLLNKKGGSYQKTKNIAKLEKKIKKLHNKLAHIRLNHIHQATSKIVKAKPFRVVMEDLNVTSMMKNKHLSKAIAEQGFNTFINQMKYKCALNGIEFTRVPRFYPSSKTCSHFGAIKKDLKLSDRTYKCSCGFIIDTDKNAAYNLAKYGLEISL